MNTTLKIRNYRDRLSEMERDPQAYYDAAFDRAKRDLVARREVERKQAKK